MTPYKSGTEYAIEGVQREVVRPTKIAAAMADKALPVSPRGDACQG
jgi:hypothetical protein